MFWEHVEVDLNGNGYEYESDYVLKVNVSNCQAKPGCGDDRDGSHIF